jgi:hypothetical protein
MASHPTLLVHSPALAPVAPFLEPAYRVLRLWDVLPTGATDDVIAVVVAGEDALDTAVLESLPNLKHVACFTSGYDGIDLDWCARVGRHPCAGGQS